MKIAKVVQDSGSPDAERLFGAFTKNLEDKEPNKPLLRAIWEGIKEAAPVLKGMVEIGAAIAKLFA